MRAVQEMQCQELQKTTEHTNKKHKKTCGHEGTQRKVDGRSLETSRTIVSRGTGFGRSERWRGLWRKGENQSGEVQLLLRVGSLRRQQAVFRSSEVGGHPLRVRGGSSSEKHRRSVGNPLATSKRRSRKEERQRVKTSAPLLTSHLEQSTNNKDEKNITWTI